MSNFTSLRKRPFRFRFYQGKAPVAITPQHGEPYRPVVALLLNETQNLLVGMQAVEKAMSPGEAREWLMRTMASPAPSAGAPCKPQVLLVADKSLQESLRFAFRSAGVEVTLDGNTEMARAMMRNVESEMSGNQTPCLVDSLGRPFCERLYRAALSFFKFEPWRHIDSDTVIAFTTPDRDQPMALVVMGSHGEQFGVILYDSVETGLGQVAGRAPRFNMFLNFSSDAYLKLADLDLIEDLGLDFPPLRLPWVLGDIRKVESVDAREAEHLLWALEQLPNFLVGQTSLSSDGYILAVAGEQDQEDKIEAFASAWMKKGKLSAKGQDIARYCLSFLEYEEEQKKCPPAELEQHRRNCLHMGQLLLQAEPRKAFDGRIFFKAPGHEAAYRQAVAPRDQDWDAYLKTWNALAEFYRFLLADYEPHSSEQVRESAEVALKVFSILVELYDSPEGPSVGETEGASQALRAFLEKFQGQERQRAAHSLLDLALQLEGSFNRKLAEEKLPPLSPRVLQEFGNLIDLVS